MKAGAQISLYAMTDQFVALIMAAVETIKRRREVETETDDLSTVILGEARDVFATVRDAFAVTTVSGVHVVLNAHFSRGCPGDDYCLTAAHPDSVAHADEPAPVGATEGLGASAVAGADQRVAGQFALYPLGSVDYLAQIYAAIDHAKEGGVFGGAKNFVSRLDGTVSAVFDELFSAFLHTHSNHTTIHATVSAHSPSSTVKERDQ